MTGFLIKSNTTRTKLKKKPLRGATLVKHKKFKATTLATASMLLAVFLILLMHFYFFA